MTTPREQFEALLDQVVERLNTDAQATTDHHAPQAFQQFVFDVLQQVAVESSSVRVDPTFHPHAFPDIRANGYGVEVKSTIKDTWLSVGNSVFEGMRDPNVSEIYVVFGKFGGFPSVRWGRYEERITHVRISHAPRFVLEMDRDSSLFDHMNVSYNEFAALSPHEKMRHIRAYSRNRLKAGERLWWLEDEHDEGRPLEVRLYMHVSQEDKVRLRAEAALLCPQIVKPSRTRNKYNDAAMYLLTVHGVFAPQTRDLFSAGSVAMRASDQRGGIYVLRALQDIETAMRDAAGRLGDSFFEEYWGVVVPREQRLVEWLRRADHHARDWRPSDHLFLIEQGKA